MNSGLNSRTLTLRFVLILWSFFNARWWMGFWMKSVGLFIVISHICKIFWKIHYLCKTFISNFSVSLSLQISISVADTSGCFKELYVYYSFRIYNEKYFCPIMIKCWPVLCFYRESMLYFTGELCAVLLSLQVLVSQSHSNHLPVLSDPELSPCQRPSTDLVSLVYLKAEWNLQPF